MSHKGCIRCIPLTSYYVPDVLYLMRNYFFKEEHVSATIGITKHPEAMRELDSLVLDVIEDGTSVIAIEENTRKVVGAMLNRVIEKTYNPEGYFKEFNFKHPVARKLNEINIALDKSVNCFELFKSDCYLESMFGTVLTEFRCKGILLNLFQSTIDIAQSLKDGHDVRVPVNSNRVLRELDKRPTGILADGTSTAVKKVLQKLRFDTAKVVNFSDTYTTVPLLPIYIMYKFLT